MFVDFEGGKVPLAVVEADLTNAHARWGDQGLRSYARLIVDEAGVSEDVVNPIVARLTTLR